MFCFWHQKLSISSYETLSTESFSHAFCGFRKFRVRKCSLHDSNNPRRVYRFDATNEPKNDRINSSFSCILEYRANSLHSISQSLCNKIRKMCCHSKSVGNEWWMGTGWATYRSKVKTGKNPPVIRILSLFNCSMKTDIKCSYFSPKVLEKPPEGKLLQANSFVEPFRGAVKIFPRLFHINANR